MPKRSNRKGDLGYTLPISDAVDQDNVFFTEEGWVYRHFKGDPNAPGTRYWDEIIVAGQVVDLDGENAPAIPTVSNNPRVHLGQKETPLRTEEIIFENVVYDTDSNRREIAQLNDNIFDVEYSHNWKKNPNLPGGGGDGSDGNFEPITEDQIIITVPDNNGNDLTSNQYYPFKFEITGNFSSAYAFAFDPGNVVEFDPGYKHMINGDTQYVFFKSASYIEYNPDDQYSGSFVGVRVWYYTNEEKTETDIVETQVRFNVIEHPDYDENDYSSWGRGGKIYFDGDSTAVMNTPVEVTYSLDTGTNFDPENEELFSFTIAESENRATGKDYDPSKEPVEQSDGKWVFPEAGEYYVKIYVSCGKINSRKTIAKWVTVNES